MNKPLTYNDVYLRFCLHICQVGEVPRQPLPYEGRQHSHTRAPGHEDQHTRGHQQSHDITSSPTERIQDKNLVLVTFKFYIVGTLLVHNIPGFQASDSVKLDQIQGLQRPPDTKSIKKNLKMKHRQTIGKIHKVNYYP